MPESDKPANESGDDENEPGSGKHFTWLYIYWKHAL